MRTRCLAVLAGALACAVSVSAAPRLLQSVRTSSPPNWLAVSPSGNQVCATSLRGLRMHRLRSDGQLVTGPAEKVLDPGRQLTCAIVSPNGRYIIATDGGSSAGCTIHIIHRETWEDRTILYPHASQAVDIDVVSQRPEAYVQFANKRLVAVDFRRAAIVYEHAIGYGASWRGRGVRARPDGLYVCPLTADMYAGFGATYALWTEPEDWLQAWSIAVEDYPVAMCVAPDPEHMIVLHRNEDYGLSVVDTDSGYVARTYTHDLTHPQDIEATPDGKWVVAVDYGTQKLTAFVAEEFRADLAMPRSIYTIRRYDCALRARPAGVTVHPRLPVAYVWSTEESRVEVVDLGEPPQ